MIKILTTLAAIVFGNLEGYFYSAPPYANVIPQTLKPDLRPKSRENLGELDKLPNLMMPLKMA